MCSLTITFPTPRSLTKTPIPPLKESSHPNILPRRNKKLLLRYPSSPRKKSSTAAGTPFPRETKCFPIERPSAREQRGKLTFLFVTDTLDAGLLKPGSCVPIFLTVVVCGTLACGVIAVFIIYRFVLEDVLDGNPSLTIVLILANVFTLQTVLPFCMNDSYLGAEPLNSRKILVTSLAFGIDFSVMLSRAFFLMFSKGGVFTAHINGYLQGLMVFFMFGVQLAISVMFFVLSTEDSAVVVRSLTFIALLGNLYCFLGHSSFRRSFWT